MVSLNHKCFKFWGSWFHLLLLLLPVLLVHLRRSFQTSAQRFIPMFSSNDFIGLSLTYISNLDCFFLCMVWRVLEYGTLTFTALTYCLFWEPANAGRGCLWTPFPPPPPPFVWRQILRKELTCPQSPGNQDLLITRVETRSPQHTQTALSQTIIPLIYSSEGSFIFSKKSATLS